MEVALETIKAARSLNKEENTGYLTYGNSSYRTKISKAEGRKLHLHFVGKVLVIHVLDDLDMFLLK